MFFKSESVVGRGECVYDIAPPMFCPPVMVFDSLARHQVVVVTQPLDEQWQLGLQVVAVTQPLRFVIAVDRRTFGIGQNRAVIDHRVHQVQRGTGDGRFRLSPTNRISRRRRSAKAGRMTRQRDGRVDVEHSPVQPQRGDQVLDAGHVVVADDDVGFQFLEPLVHLHFERQFGTSPCCHVRLRQHAELRRDVPGRQIQAGGPEPVVVAVRHRAEAMQILRAIIGDDSGDPELTMQGTTRRTSPSGMFDQSRHVLVALAGGHRLAVAITEPDVPQGGQEEDAQRPVARQGNAREIWVQQVSTH